MSAADATGGAPVRDGGLKHDADKPPVDLLDPEAMLAIAAVLGFGARKYAAHNWRNGIAWSRLYAAVQRHLLAFWMGEEVDPESGLPHLAHASCGLMFLSWHAAHRRDLDDRWQAE
jgi:hypothetical protein